jgi:hypothetical protein
MSSRTRNFVIAGVAVVVLAAGGAGVALAVSGDSDESVSGPRADAAAKAALDAVGGKSVSEVERADDGQAGWEVEVKKPDGSQVEVHLNQDLEPVGSAPDDDGPGDEDGAGDDG